MGIRKPVIMMIFFAAVVFVSVSLTRDSLKPSIFELTSLAEELQEEKLTIIEVKAEAVPTAETLIEEVKNSYEKMEDYFTILISIELKEEKGKTKEQKRIMRYYFKKPYLVRTEITYGTEPNDKGSEAIYLGGDKIKGHQGGLLSRIALSVNINSKLALSLRGHNIRDGTADSMVKRIGFYQENGEVTLGEKVKFDNRDVIALNLSLTETEEVLKSFPDDIELKQGVTRELIYIDLGYNLPIAWEQYVGDRLVRNLKYEDLRINLGLPGEIFESPRLKKELRRQLDKLIGEGK